MIRIILDQLYSALWLNENYLCMHRKKHRTSIKRPFLAVSQTKNKKKKTKKIKKAFPCQNRRDITFSGNTPKK